MTKKCLLLTSLVLTLPLAVAKAGVYTNTGWAQGDTLNWFNVTNWSPRGVPGASDTIYIAASVANPNWSFTDLHLIGGDLLGPLTVGGTLTWFSGRLSGAVTVPSNGVVRLAFTEAGILSGVLVNQGLVVWPTSSWSGMVLDGGRLENLLGGVVELQLDGDFHPGNAPGVFNNAGIFRKIASGHVNPGGSDWAQFRPGVAFSNSGLVDLQSGTMRFTDGFTSSGRFAVATNTILQLTGGTFRLLPGHFFDGPGTYGACIGAVVIDGPITEPHFLLENASLMMSNEITGTLLWSGYATLGGAPTIASNGTIKVINPPGGFPVTLTGVLTNRGLFLWPSNTYAAIVLDNARFENQPGALLDMQLGGSFYAANAGGQINNAGLIRVRAGNDTAAFKPALRFNHTGVLDLQEGTLQFNDGFTSSGTFLVRTNTRVRMSGGTYHCLSGHAFVGAGHYGVDADGVIDGPITEPNFQVWDGLLRMTNQITGTLVWRGGQLGGAPTIASGGVVCCTSTSWALTLAGTLTNHGLFLWPSGTYAAMVFSNGKLQNMADGVVDMQLDGGFYSDDNGGQVNNWGVFRKSAGGGTAQFVGKTILRNFSLLDVQRGTLRVPGNSLFPGSRINCALRSATDFGGVAFNGTASLAGTLSAQLVNGFNPPAGTRFEIITSTSLSGAFSALSLPDRFYVTDNGSSMFVVVGGGGPVELASPALVGTNFTFRFQTESGQSYTVERNEHLELPNWTVLDTFLGDGGMRSFLIPAGGFPQAFFRVRQP